jgi:hypothetical protein
MSLYACSDLNEIDSISLDFILKAKTNESASIGKPMKIGITVDGLDKNATCYFKTIISIKKDNGVEAYSDAVVEVKGELILDNEDISHNYFENNTLYFDFIPNQCAIYTLAVSVSNGTVAKTTQINIDCSNSYFLITFE